MSTRGTYQVSVRKHAKDGIPYDYRTQTFYCHSDNYPEGAAAYFHKALALEWKYQVHGINMIKRLAALDGFEFIDCHDDHGDTEYRYNIYEGESGLTVEAFKEHYNSGSFSQWVLFFDGPISEFIEKWRKA
jgi:hypothetical protein